MSQQMTLWDSLRSTSSPGSGAGASPPASPDGPMTVPCGQAHAHASPSLRPGSGAAPTTSATCGPSCVGSLTSADLQSSLESRLQAALGATGSPLYVLTWKSWAMRSGPRICALRGSARRTSGSGSTGERSGWPTPVRQDASQSARTTTDAQKWSKNVIGNTDHTSLDAARLAGWATPTARDYRFPNLRPWVERGGGTRGEQLNNQAAHLACWTAEDGPARLTVDGRMLTGSTAGMPSGGQLNPTHSRWLMGYPAAWDGCAATATPSSRRLQRSSSRASTKRVDDETPPTD